MPVPQGDITTTKILVPEVVPIEEEADDSPTEQG
jgi:hypothetical protein